MTEQKEIKTKKVKNQLEKHSKVKPRAEVAQKGVARDGNQEKTEENNEVTSKIKCREFDFSGRTQNELDKHHMIDCSEALIHRLIEEENEFACGTDFSGKMSGNSTNRTIIQGLSVQSVE